jgi:hypothetical protein
MLAISITSLPQIFWHTFSTKYKWRHCCNKWYLRVHALSFPKQTVIWKTHKLTHNGLPAKLYQDRTAIHCHPCVRDVSGYDTPIFHVNYDSCSAAHYIHPTSYNAFPQPYLCKIAVKMTKQFRLHTPLNRQWICSMQRPAWLHTFLPQVHTTNNLCPVLCNTQIHKTAKCSFYILWIANPTPKLNA